MSRTLNQWSYGLVFRDGWLVFHEDASIHLWGEGHWPGGDAHIMLGSADKQVILAGPVQEWSVDVQFKQVMAQREPDGEVLMDDDFRCLL